MKSDQQRGLDLAVLVTPKHVLERLERLDHRLHHLFGVDPGAEQLEQVAELLALLA